MHLKSCPFIEYALQTIKEYFPNVPSKLSSFTRLAIMIESQLFHYIDQFRLKTFENGRICVFRVHNCYRRRIITYIFKAQTKKSKNEVFLFPIRFLGRLFVGSESEATCASRVNVCCMVYCIMYIYTRGVNDVRNRSSYINVLLVCVCISPPVFFLFSLLFCWMLWRDVCCDAVNSSGIGLFGLFGYVCKRNRLENETCCRKRNFRKTMKSSGKGTELK